MKRATWWIAMSLCATLLLATAFGVSEAEAGDVGGIRFTFGQVLTIAAVAAAWGEMRMRVTNIEKRLDKRDLKKENAK